MEKTGNLQTNFLSNASSSSLFSMSVSIVTPPNLEQKKNNLLWRQVNYEHLQFAFSVSFC